MIMYIAMHILILALIENSDTRHHLLHFVQFIPIHTYVGIICISIVLAMRTLYTSQRMLEYA